MSQALYTFWAQHAPVLSVLLPAFTAVGLLLWGDADDPARVRWMRRLSLVSGLAGLALAAALVAHAATGELMVYRLGDWPAPYGIVLVVDRLSALMVLLTYLVAAPVLWYACGGWDMRGRFFHALFHFQLMGLAGAFVTGDLFNLFVFFEVLLIASYVLLVHGRGGERFKVGVQYVVLNLVASGLFLIGLAMLYSVTGTLNMADMALRVAALDAESAALARSAALLLLVVFGLKAALVPVYAWLPATYAAASAPVAALFAIMTKVGVYSIVRVHWGIFGTQGGEAALAAGDWLLPLALLTSALGVVGALAAHSLSRMVAYLTVSSVGTTLAVVGLFTEATLSAALYYTLHSTLVVAGLFLLVELLGAQRGAMQDRLQPAPAVREPVVLGLTLLFAAASVAGLPPLPGFLGKVMVLQSAVGLPGHAWVWTVVLLAGFFTLIGLARAGVVVFWHVEPTPEAAAPSAGRSPQLLLATWSFMAMGVALAVWASPVKRYTDAAAAQFANQTTYAQAVLGLAAGQPSNTTRPYSGAIANPTTPPAAPVSPSAPAATPASAASQP